MIELHNIGTYLSRQKVSQKLFTKWYIFVDRDQQKCYQNGVAFCKSKYHTAEKSPRYMSG